jgi:hypothetical protein
MPNGYTDRVFKGEFCGVYEIAEFAKVTKAQIAHWLRTDWFPRPVDEPKMGRVWRYQDVVAALTEKGYPREPKKSGKRAFEKRYSLDSVPTEE